MANDSVSGEAIATGARVRTAYLIQQANATLAMAEAEGPALSALLPANLLVDTAKVRDEVDKMRGDKAVMEAEAKQATDSERDQLRDVKVWRRKPAKRSQRARRAGAKVPDELVHIGSAKTVPAVLNEVSRTLALLTEYTPALDAIGPPTQPLIDQGKLLYQALQAADRTQEHSRASELPATVAAFYAKKNELYNKLKMINDAGQELYAHDLQSAARFNLSILHRRRGQAAEPTPPAPTPGTPSTPPSSKA